MFVNRIVVYKKEARLSQPVLCIRRRCLRGLLCSRDAKADPLHQDVCRPQWVTEASILRICYGAKTIYKTCVQLSLLTMKMLSKLSIFSNIRPTLTSHNVTSLLLRFGFEKMGRLISMWPPLFSSPGVLLHAMQDSVFYLF